MLYMGYLIILDGQNIKRICFGKFHFWLPRPEKYISRLCALDPLVPPPPITHTPK